MENVDQQTAEELKAEENRKAEEAKKKAAAEDPLKAGKPKELKGDKGGGKIKKMEGKEDADEGIVPEEGKDDEAKTIEKLTEVFTKLTEESNLTQDVTALIAKAKEALDKGEYENARGFCDRLEQVQMAVSEPEAVAPPVMDEPCPMDEPEIPMEGKDDEPAEPVEGKEDPEKKEEPVEGKEDPEKKEDKEAPLA
jgi:hypothetical protein